MNTEGAKENVGEKPGYLFELGANLGSERTFSIRGNFPVGMTAEMMNVELDKLVKACDRQLSKACIPNMENEIAEMNDQLRRFEEDLADTTRNQGKHKALPAVEVAKTDNQKTNIAAMKGKIQRKMDFLGKTRKDAA